MLTGMISSVSGKVDASGTNLAVDSDAVFASGSGNNIAIGNDAADGMGALSNLDNIFIGNNAGGGTWTGSASSYNIGIGSGVMDAAMNGALRNTGMGYGTLGGITSGDDNTAIGATAGNAIGSGSDNVAIGSNALAALTTGVSNIVIGKNALDAAVLSESYNIVIGQDAMGIADEGTGGGSFDHNIAIGFEALQGSDFGSANRSYNGHVAIGHQALKAGSGSISSTGNVGIGYQAGTAITDGQSNIAIGYQAMDANQTSDYNIAIGKAALGALTNDGDTGNVAIGYNAGLSIVGGANNTIIGTVAGDGFDAESDNTFIGYNSGGGAINGADQCVAIGSQTFQGAATVDGTVVIGYQAGQDISSGGGNTAVGMQAGKELSTGGGNTFIGAYCGDGVVTSHQNTAVGYVALGAVAGNNNTAMGYGAGQVNSGLDNTFLGFQAGDVNTGGYNVIVGSGALGSGVDVDKAVVVGQQALYSANEDDASGTVAIGWAAGYYSVPASGDALSGGNTLIGYSAGTDVSGANRGLTTGKQNTTVGHQTLGANAGTALTGGSNTVMGYRAGYIMQGNASYSTFIGWKAGDSLTTGLGNTCLGYQTDVQATSSYQTAIGYTTSTQQTSETRIGRSGGLQFVSKIVGCDIGGDTANDPAHVTPICQIPRYGVVIKATAIIYDRNTDANHSLRLVLSTRATGIQGTPLTDVEEIIGVNATNSWCSHGAAGASKDIDVSSSGISHQAFAAVPYDPAGATDSGLATVDTTASGGKYVYLAFADTGHTNGNSAPTAAPQVLVMIEFVGQL